MVWKAQELPELTALCEVGRVPSRPLTPAVRQTTGRGRERRKKERFRVWGDVWVSFVRLTEATSTSADFSVVNSGV